MSQRSTWRSGTSCRRGRRPLRRDGRHDRDLGLTGRADHGSAGLLVPGPDDRLVEGAEPAEDAKRDRPQRPAGGHHHRILIAVVTLSGLGRYSGPDILSRNSWRFS